MKNYGSIKNGVLYKSVNPKKHILRVANAYGIDLGKYNELPEDGEIVLKEPTRKLWASKALFERHAFTRDFGAGVQKFLPLEKWLLIIE